MVARRTRKAATGVAASPPDESTTSAGPAGFIEYVAVPVTHPTMPCFGGPDGRAMYVTSLRENLSEGELERTPLAGGVFMFKPGVAGAPAALYQG